MGCGSSKVHDDVVCDALEPESDVDVASVKDFDQEQREAALRVSREHSAAPRSSYTNDQSLEHSAAPVDQISLKSVQGDQSLEQAAGPVDQISLKSVTGELPPVRPPRLAKVAIFPSPSFLTDTQSLLHNVPESAESSVTSLASHLTSSSPSDLHAVRAIFCWIAHNISYDSEGLFSGDIPSQEANLILTSRKSVCEGYANLCESLCSLANIPCLKVKGISKGYSHDLEAMYTPKSPTNHAWNLVLVGGEWRPLDCTWGAGHLQGNGSFRQQFDDHWFLTDPEEFLPTHFPYMDGDLASSEKFQLVPNPIDLATFSSMIKLSTVAYRVGLQLLTHPQGVIADVIGDVTVRVRTTKERLKLVTAHLTEKTTDAEEDGSGVLTSCEDDDTFTITVRPARAVTYLLEVFGQVEGTEGNTLTQLCVYAIRCVKTEPSAHPFPQITGMWGVQYPIATECGLRVKDRGAFKFTAVDGKVKVPISTAAGNTDVSVKLYHAVVNPEEDLRQNTFVEYAGDDVVVHVRLPRAGHFLLRVFASHPELKGTHHVAVFLLQSEQPCTDCLPYPKCYCFAEEIRATLLQPLVRHVPKGVATLFRVRAPGLGEVSVSGHKMERGVDGVWEAEVIPEDDGNGVLIYGAVDKGSTSLSGLYAFDLV